MVLYKQTIKHKQIKCNIFIDKCDLLKIKNQENESTLSIIEKCVNEIETNHILLNDFNLHYSL